MARFGPQRPRIKKKVKYHLFLTLKIPQGNHVFLMIFEIKGDFPNNINLVVFTKEKQRLHTERIRGDNLFFVLLTLLSVLRKDYCTVLVNSLD